MPNPTNFDHIEVMPGRPYPTGPTTYSEGVRFTIFSRHATRVWIALFNKVTDQIPAWEIEFNPQYHKTGDMWSIYLKGLQAPAYYMFRMDGPSKPDSIHRFDPALYLLDPYARAFVGNIHDRTMKSVVDHGLDWTYDARPRLPLNELVIYETHVKGLTVHSSAEVKHGGTYAGLTEKIPYLKDLGVTAVELLPVHEFGETYLSRKNPDTGEELVNYWGYSNIGFFAPASKYACSAVDIEHLAEFRNMVAELHKNNIEVILDVVFNHTSEGNEKGPTLCFRGIDNSIYYLLDEDGDYKNYSGCGNTVNCNHPLVRDFILDCLRYWVAVMHIDGFRFDLASILGRDQNGHIQEDAPLIMRIAEDPVLRDVKLIAEAWDAGGAYQVGSFGGGRWAEWNGKYRDDIRRYWRGDEHMRGNFASRISGSSDVYAWAGRSPVHSINFVTCHDGFTLRDLVSYNEKHNWANGEDNQDGSNHDNSFNCGIEGDENITDEIAALRRKMQKNFIATLFLSLGIPMLLGGDEMGRTQQGNNNAYCQDNEIAWYDWNLLDAYKDMHRFTKEMIRFRKANTTLMRKRYFTGTSEFNNDDNPDLVWFAPEGNEIKWNSSEAPLGCHIHDTEHEGPDLCLLFNSSDKPVRFHLPEGTWLKRIDTHAESPLDIVSMEKAKPVQSNRIQVESRSLVVLCAPA